MFVTKKKAIPSIIDDYTLLNRALNFAQSTMNLYVSNLDYDMIILDEAHTLGAYPNQVRELNKSRKL